MKLWLLTRVEKPDEEYWPHYDQAVAFVVRAENEEHARSLASAQAGDEQAKFWGDPRQSDCVRLRHSGAAEVILRDYNAG
jgi:hypothetical protein